VADAEFIENAAHQLRTPITSVAVAAAALTVGAKDDPEERDRFIAHIARDSDRMARVIESLLALARIQRGGSALLVAVVPLEPFLREIVAEARPRAGVGLEIDCAPSVAVVGDAAILREAIANVVRNAAEHTHAGTIRINGRRDGGRTILEIADTGTGIPAEIRPRVFERFFHAGGANRRGAGLGLAIAAEAAQVHGGTLELVDVPVGTTFRFTLRGARLM
jgi:signal transduction histidine kinase